MKIAIAGGKGFIGRALAQRLRAKHTVEILDLPEVNILDQAALRGALSRFGPAVVVNLAGILGGVNSKNISEIISINFGGNQNLIEACIAEGVKRFVFASSLTIHGENNLGDHRALPSPFRPKHAYGASKAAAEFALMQYARLYGMSVVSLRPTIVLGDTLVAHAPIDFITAALSGKAIEIFGKGEHEREWIWIDDAADGFLRATEFCGTARAGYYPFFLGGNRINMRDLAGKCTKRLGGTVQYIPSEARAFSLTADSSETRKTLGWEAKTDIDSIIEELIPIIQKRIS